MPVGSSYSTVKEAMWTRLRARAGLSSVAVSPDPPADPLNVRGPSGSGDAIWIADAEGSYENVVLGAPGLWLEELYDLTLVIQAMPTNSTDTQLRMDRRVDEMLYEVLQETAGDPSWGVTDFVYVQIARGPFRRLVGPIEGRNIRPARCELDLNVECRIRFDGST